MQYQDFIGQVQSRARLPSEQDAVRATRATLETLGERLVGGQADNAAAQLPPEIGRFLTDSDHGQEFSSDEFLHRVSDREDLELPNAVFHARAVLDVLGEAISEGELEKIRAQLPDDFARLFEAGSEGRMRRT